VWQTADLVSPGYVAANRALLSIEHESPRRFVPVPADVRARAYAASPAFRELRPHLEGDRWGHRVSCVMVRVCDDLAGGWFLWTFREAAAEAGHMRSAAQGDAYFLEIADDLSAACERGEIRCRPVWLPFLHPHVEAWLPFFPESLLDVVGRMVTAGRDRDRLLLADSPRLEAEVRERFDRVGNRDAELVRSGWALVEGHASSESDPIVQVELRGGRQRVVLMGDSGVTQTPQDFVPLAFELQMAKGRRLTERPVLLISRVSGARTQVYVGSAIEAPVERDGVRVELSAQPSRPADASRKAVAWLLWHGHAWALRGLAVLALVAGAWGIARRRPRLAEPLWAIFVLVAVGIVGRVLLLAMVDASSFAAASSRYVYPASALLAFALLVFVVAIWRAPPRAGGR
jgi:hypothetical protein